MTEKWNTKILHKTFEQFAEMCEHAKQCKENSVLFTLNDDVFVIQYIPDAIPHFENGKLTLEMKNMTLDEILGAHHDKRTSI